MFAFNQENTCFFFFRLAECGTFFGTFHESNLSYFFIILRGNRSLYSNTACLIILKKKSSNYKTKKKNLSN
ncbi:MAG: hypothetical protein D3916_02820 [Candidatus Electrothrix sp. MAN1_4]|nr:hypothetical protein [Candidatus Electrothrix sp. MAN1_4]